MMVEVGRISLINLTGGASVWALPHCEDIHHTLYSNRHMVPTGPPILILTIIYPMYCSSAMGCLVYIDRCDRLWGSNHCVLIVTFSREGRGSRCHFDLLSFQGFVPTFGEIIRRLICQFLVSVIWGSLWRMMSGICALWLRNTQNKGT